MERMPFSEVLGLLESHGWKLQRIVPKGRRTFVRSDGRPPLIQFPVSEDGYVDGTYVAKILHIIQNPEGD
jgi:hypothetical protein